MVKFINEITNINFITNNSYIKVYYKNNRIIKTEHYFERELHYMQLFFYDSEGRIIRNESYDNGFSANDKIISVYSNNKLAKSIYYTNNNLRSYNKYVYDDENSTFTEYFYNNKNNLISYYKYHYNKKDNYLVTEWFDKKGNYQNISKIIRYYDINGNITNTLIYDKHNKLKEKLHNN